ncbi:hypothetical protein CN918_27040 [Priestia megaterium]|nr:hypothetical protein CN918_27040 [Priestia megaterium]
MLLFFIKKDEFANFVLKSAKVIKRGDWMKFAGFSNTDFELFTIEGLDERMGALIRELRPKFHALGEDLKDELSLITGEEITPHVAKHARRKKNPPNDSWVAFAANTRGYKMMPHFQIAVWHTHVLVQWGIIYEAINKGVFADNLVKHLDEIKENIPGHFQWSKDHMKPEGTIQAEMTDKDFEDFAKRLKYNKNGEIMVGLNIPREKAIEMTPNGFYRTVIDTWSKLDFLHKLTS